MFYTLHICLLYKSNETIWIFYGKFADNGDNPWTTPKHIQGTD